MLATLQSPEHLALVIGTVLLLALPSLPYDPSLVNHAQTRSNSDSDADLRSYSDSPILRSLTLRPAPTHPYSDSHILSHTTTLSVLMLIIKQLRPYTPTHTLIVRFTHTQTPPHSDSRMHTHSTKKEGLTHSQTQTQPHSCALKACHSGAPGGPCGRTEGVSLARLRPDCGVVSSETLHAAPPTPLPSEALAHRDVAGK